MFLQAALKSSSHHITRTYSLFKINILKYLKNWYFKINILNFLREENISGTQSPLCFPKKIRLSTGLSPLSSKKGESSRPAVHLNLQVWRKSSSICNISTYWGRHKPSTDRKYEGRLHPPTLLYSLQSRTDQRSYDQIYSPFCNYPPKLPVDVLA